MFTSITIENFRALKHLTLNDLGRVNLIAGKNNTGKTSVLEALFLLSGSLRRPDVRFTIDIMRGVENAASGQNSSDAWKPIFTDFNTMQPVKVSAINPRDKLSLSMAVVQPELISVMNVPSVNETENSLATTTDTQNQIEYLYEVNTKTYRGHVRKNDNQQWEVQHDKLTSTFPAIFLFSRTRIDIELKAEYFSRAQKMGLKDEMIRYLKIIEPRLIDLALLSENGRTFIHGSGIIGKSISYAPIALMGDGINRLLDILLAVIFASTQSEDNGIVLIDEIENGFHYSSLEQVWNVIGIMASSRNVQVFATTHSYEGIEAAHKAFSEGDEYDFRLHRLDRRKDGNIEPVTFSREALTGALDLNFEVR